MKSGNQPIVVPDEVVWLDPSVPARWLRWAQDAVHQFGADRICEVWDEEYVLLPTPDGAGVLCAIAGLVGNDGSRALVCMRLEEGEYTLNWPCAGSA